MTRPRCSDQVASRRGCVWFEGPRCASDGPVVTKEKIAGSDVRRMQRTAGAWEIQETGGKVSRPLRFRAVQVRLEVICLRSSSAMRQLAVSGNKLAGPVFCYINHGLPGHQPRDKLTLKSSTNLDSFSPFLLDVCPVYSALHVLHDHVSPSLVHKYSESPYQSL